MTSTKYRASRVGGFTLVELMIVVAIIGILAAVAIPAFMAYLQKAKTSEARQMVRAIYTGARTYYLDRNGAKDVATANTNSVAQFPRSASGITPALGTCCSSGSKCMPSSSLWEDDVWQSLQFSMGDPHFYMYHYTSMPTASFTAYAYGDLDCDNVYSTFSMEAVGASSLSEGTTGTAAIHRNKELE